MSKINAKGQSSFELLFVLSVVVILATIVITTGVRDLNNVSALAYTHNSLDQYIVKESPFKILKIDLAPSGDSLNVIIYTKDSVDGSQFEKYKQNIETNIKEKTKYTSVNVSVVNS